MAKKIDISGIENFLDIPTITPNTPAPPITASTSEEPGSLHDLLLGMGQGATLGFGDELLAAAQSGSDVLSSKAGIDKFYNTYRKHQKENEKSVEEAHKRSPWLTGGGELAGSLLIPGGAAIGEVGTAAGLGAKALAAGKAGAKFGALAGAGYSKADIEHLPELAEDTAMGTGAGAVLGAAGEAVIDAAPKVLTAAKNSFGPARLMAQSIESGMQGKGFSLESSGQRIAGDAEKLANDTVNKLVGPEDSLLGKTSKGITDVFKQAEEQGARLAPNTAETQIADLENIMSNMPQGIGIDIETNKAQGSFGKLKQDLEKLRKGEMGPQEGYNISRWLSGESVPGFGRTGAPKSLRDLAQDVGIIPALKAEARNAAGRVLDTESAQPVEQAFNKWQDVRGMVTDPLINSGRTQQFDPNTGKRLRDMTLSSEFSSPELATELQNTLLDLVKKSGDPAAHGDPARTLIEKFVQGSKKLAESHPEMNIDPDKIRAALQDVSTQKALRDKIVSQAGGSNPLDLLQDVWNYATYGTGNLAGKAIYTGNKLVNLADPGLLSTANLLKGSKATGWIGQALEDAVNNKSRAAKNSAIFSIMQNPDARKLLNMPLNKKENE